ncbi:aspartyl-phosphate phosphatase Spo0E family protein [Sutcliffiella rhizosphaerae]|uniref:Aspartyl-phosphate phosphatase Spo0E family protein n=1 Tax=Sutcliffiella rhizosphaerae TaxID=2880967 RepID=A0ABN8A901_9BACI|nr:aspartyl-phosphate phosphatase Spo0E family protein [Sutcliffiella rhizosphaerae]CAG9620861.1 hypothetical protein BACCIP111883_01632 [Sutcliffiella rhizosphaerae]
MVTVTVIERLLSIIEYRKKELTQLALSKDFHDPKIIKQSQELDKLIYKYQTLSLYKSRIS